ncbi:NAD-binding protein, partial [Vibrio parahaemolyticus]
IIGCGRVGRIVADLLRAHGKRFVTVEADIDAARAASDDGYPVIFGDVARAAFADRLHLGRADALVLT